MKLLYRLLFAGLAIGSLAALVGYAVWIRQQPVTGDPVANAATDANAELAEEKQKAIWDAEHVTFEIEQRLGKRLLAELASDDRDQLLAHFRSDFRGTMLPPDAPVEHQDHGGVVQTRRTATGTAAPSRGVEGEGVSRGTGADELVDSLRSRWSTVPNRDGAMLRVLQIQRNAQQTDLWHTEWLLACHGTSQDGTPRHWQSTQQVDVLLPSEEEKIDQQPVIASWTAVDEVERSSPRWRMEEVTEQFGLASLPLPDNWKLPVADTQQNRFQVAVEDFDGDGFLDLAIAVLNAPPILLRSKNGESFEDVTSLLGLPPGYRPPYFRYAAAWIDFDNDGFVDLFLGDRLYQNIKGRRFVDVTRKSRIDPGDDCMGVLVADYDCDGWLDLYMMYQEVLEDSSGDVAKELPKWVDEGESGVANRLWRNRGDGTFEDVTSVANASGGRRHTHAGTWLFYDDDHLPDLYTANDFGRNVLLRNAGQGMFADVSERSHAAGYATSMGVTSGDLDNDGQAEIYVANMYSKMGRRIIGQVCAEDYPAGIFEQIQGSCAGNRLYSKSSTAESFTETADAWGINAVGWAYGPAMFDADHDGLLDLYSTTGFMSFQRGKPDG